MKNIFRPVRLLFGGLVRCGRRLDSLSGFLAVVFSIFTTTNPLLAQWVQTDLDSVLVSSFAVSGTNLFAGTTGGVFRSTNNGTSWTAANTGLPTNIVARALVTSGADLFAGMDGGVFRSTNNGTSWTLASTGLTHNYVRPLAVSSGNLFAGTAGGGVFLSTNNGTSWTAVNTGLTNPNVNTFAVSGPNLFAGTYGGVFLSTNSGTSWTAASTGLTNPYVLSLAVSGTNLFAGTVSTGPPNGGVFLSTNNGTSWTATGLTNTDVRSLAVSRTNLFAGTQGGVFLSDNNGTSWTDFNTGLMDSSVYALAVSVQDLFAGTPGGVWRRQLPRTMVVTNTSDSGPGSLRQAILSTNSTAGLPLDWIYFNIPGVGPHSIRPTTPLPNITSPVEIDGYTQPGSSPNTSPSTSNAVLRIELSGLNAPSGSDGLVLKGGVSTVRGLAINRWPVSGFTGGGNAIIVDSLGGTAIEGCYIGTNVSGDSAAANGNRGIFLTGTAAGNRIGGTLPAQRNVISGNSRGVHILGAISGANFVVGNIIGLKADGNGALGNVTHGVHIEGSGANRIGDTVGVSPGGPCTGGCNVISSNGFANSGVRIEGATAVLNRIQSNYIGLTADGIEPRGNFNGVAIVNAANNSIGGPSTVHRNLISGQLGHPGCSGVLIGEGSSGTSVQSNYIGTDVSGTLSRGNSTGLYILDSPDNTVGGLTSAPGLPPGNVISASGESGVYLQNYATTSTSGNVILGNLIGTDVTGTLDLGNGTGVSLSQASANFVGGIEARARNIISGNRTGVTMSSGFNQARFNTVQGNYIGTDITGMADLGNDLSGISINYSDQNLIGGTTPEARNVISGNGSVGGGGSINAPGISLIAGSANVIQGNYIGIAADGLTPLGNLGDGVSLTNSPGNIQIGGMVPGSGNVIAYNGFPQNFSSGIHVDAGTGNRILSNSIHSNISLFSLGIDLSPGGITANDSLDADIGANGLQNYPVLTYARGLPASTFVEGTLNSVPNNQFTVQCFSNSQCDTSGYGEGKTYLGTTAVATGGNGNAVISVIFPVAAPVGHFITATATDTAGNTSEFSQCRIVEGITSVGSLEEVPQVFALYQNYPNPFNPLTTIRYDVPTSTHVSLKVYNVLGQEVATLVNETKVAGRHRVEWNSIGVVSGVYWYRFQAGSFVQTKNLLLLK
ncbi:MAG: quiC [Bacteroidetes bacterium]|nr:quiC [Bacteroidota bacterium]